MYKICTNCVCVCVCVCVYNIYVGLAPENTDFNSGELRAGATYNIQVHKFSKDSMEWLYGVNILGTDI
jgi:hypothetical protein